MNVHIKEDEDLTAIDVAALREQAQAEQALNTLDRLGSVNLDEVTTDIVPVAFVEFEPHESGGVKRMKPRVRHAEIIDYVPMYLLNRALANERKIKKIRAKIDAEEMEEPEEDVQMTSLQRSVYEVWKLSEPEMTFDRFKVGLELSQVMGLYNRFFGVRFRQMTSKA